MEALKSEAEAFIQTHPYGASLQFDPESGNHDIRVSGAAPTEPPLVLSVILGDFIHNLRSALDHLIWQIVVIMNETPGRWTSFPLYDDPDDFTKRVRKPWEQGKKSALLGLDSATFAAVERLQPYNRQAGKEHGLGVLNTLSNIDKHQLVHASMVVMSDEAPTVTGSGFDAVRYESGPYALKDEAVVGRIAFFGSDDSDMQVQMNLTVDIRFGKMQVPFSRLPNVRNAVVSTLNIFIPGFPRESPPD